MKNVFVSKAICKKQWINFALLICWSLMLWAGMKNAQSLKTIYPAVSLRYDTPLPGNIAANARKTAASHLDSLTFWPTFWSEQLDVPAEGIHAANTRCLWFSGDATLVWPTIFLQGDYPAPLDTSVCAISNTLAFELWGNGDVVGHTVMVQNKYFTVCGVFKEKERLMMIGTAETSYDRGWQAAELYGISDGELRTSALDFAQTTGLGAPNTLVDGPALCTFVSLVSVIPAWLVGITVCVYLFKWFARNFPDKKHIVCFMGLLIFAFLLPSMFEMLPSSFVPTRFSDYSFWGRLITLYKEQIKEWLLLRPRYIDLRAKLAMMMQISIFVIQMVFSGLLIYRNFARSNNTTSLFKSNAFIL